MDIETVLAVAWADVAVWAGEEADTCGISVTGLEGNPEV